jgi:hypothetical protein
VASLVSGEPNIVETATSKEPGGKLPRGYLLHGEIEIVKINK